MKRILAQLLLISAIAHADVAPVLSEAHRALEEGIPQVGLEKLRLYQTTNLSEAERQSAKLEMARAYIALNRTAEARETLSQLPPSDECRFLFVQSLLCDKNWSEVSQTLEMLPDPASSFFARTVFARAEARRSLGQISVADADYQSIEGDQMLGAAASLRRADLLLQTGKTHSASLPLFSNDHTAKDEPQMALLLRAQNELLKKNYPLAESRFRSVLETSSQLSSTAFAVAQIGLAQSLAAQKLVEEAENLLEQFIEERPNHQNLSDVFTALYTLYQRERNPSQTQLRRWSKNTANPERQALAIFYQSRFDLRDRGPAVALETLSNWLDKFPNHPLRARVLLQSGEQLAEQKLWPAAILRFQEGLTLAREPDTNIRLHCALAFALFSTGDFVSAAEQYNLAAQEPSSSRQTNLYNTALCWLRATQLERFQAVYQTFSTLFPMSPLRCDLILEEGLLRARLRQLKEAVDSLTLAIRSFPKHQRIADAYLALSEIALTTNSSDTDYAKSQLALAAQSPTSAETAERVAYLQLFQKSEDPGFNTKKQIEDCENFIKEHPNSKLEAEIRFKMGEAWFAEKNYAAAGTQFEIISSQFPDSPLVEQARFLAGQSAIRTMNPSATERAISLFQQVVDMKGTLQTYARFEQASSKKNSGFLDEALVLFNDLLDQKLPDDLLMSALAAKGETLYLLGSSNPERLNDAISTLTILANTPKVSRNFRNLALYKIGKAWGLLGKKESMLAAFYDILAAPTAADETPEFFWFYRAGFEAAETLESDQQWKGAISIYQKLAEAEGPRSAESRERIERLRLEHFIWEK